MLVELVLIKKLLSNQKSVSATTGVFTPSSATSVDAEKAIEKVQNYRQKIKDAVYRVGR